MYRGLSQQEMEALKAEVDKINTDAQQPKTEAEIEQVIEDVAATSKL